MKKRYAHLLTALGVIFLLSFQINAQVTKSLGPVSELSINEMGQLECVMHENDAFSDSFHADMTNLKSMSSTKINSSANSQNSGGASIEISVFVDPSVPFPQINEAIVAFVSAVEIWSSKLTSEVPIQVALVLQPLGPGVLGSAGPTFIFRDFAGLERESWYGNALADKLSGEDLSPGFFDIVARFSTEFPNWYFGTDGNTPANDYDFQTVVLHELCHGLGYFGSMTVDNSSGVGNWGFGIPDTEGNLYPSIYDRLMGDKNGKQLIKQNKFENFSTELGEALLTGPILARGPKISKATNGKGLKTFTTLDSEIFGVIPGLTDVWLPGSSYSHQDFLSYAGTPEGLMVPFLSRGNAVTDPGPLVLGVMNDIGWNGKVTREVHLKRFELITKTNSKDLSLRLFPNPVKNHLNVNLGEQEESIESVTIADGLGRELIINRTNHSTNYFNINIGQYGLEPGIYYLIANGIDGNKEVAKFTVQ